MELIKTADQCVDGEMIALVSYPRNDNSHTCLIYPKFLSRNGIWEQIDPIAFPNNGSFAGAITGGVQISDVKDSIGNLVVAKVNRDAFDEDYFYSLDDSSRAKYRLAFNPSFQRGDSELELFRFSDHTLSYELIQVIELNNNPTFRTPFTEAVIVGDDVSDLVCQFILVRNKSGNYFGPFEYVKKEENRIELVAPSVNDYRIARFDAFDNDLILHIDVDTYYKRGKYDFLPRHDVNNLFNAISDNEKLDLLPQKEFLNIVTRAVNTSDSFNVLNKSQLRSIKTAIRDYSDTASRIRLDSSRKERIIKWLSSIDNWITMPDEIMANVAKSIDVSSFLDLISQDQYFPLFKDQIIENSGVRDRVEEEKQKLETNLLETRRQLDQLKTEIKSAKKEKEEIDRKIAESNKDLEKVRDEALEQKRHESDRLDNEIEEKEKEIERLNEEYERLIVNKNRIDDDVKRIISGINDEVATSTKILESEILKKVISAVSGFDLRNEDNEPVIEYPCLRSKDTLMSDGDTVDILFEGVTQRAGRQFSKNDVINLMICLTQGYITTLAGLPGTGKTSLCNALAGVLGLTNNEAGKRFTEINVENGWTSYKDYVGYYNPLADTYEKANENVYNAMHRLSNEYSENIDISKIPPYIFLLDEANLSPIEHYWSPFLRACDSFQEYTELSLGGSQIWHLPKYVRFLATVNFDHTTEALSNRFLDRSWVITLSPDYFDLEFEQIDFAREFANEDAFSFEELLRVFDYNKDDVPDQDNIQLLDDLARICKQHAYPISPRSLIMMKKYIASASRLMSLKTRDSKYAPIDYAFSQKVLPQLTGPAELIESLVDDLIKRCSELKNTKSQLDRMKAFGKDSGFYQYFI